MSADQHNSPIIVWLRNDLRLEDHPALSAACETGRDIICAYILEEDEDLKPLGGASRWWLDKSLKALRSDISSLGGKLVCRRGKAQPTLDALMKETGAGAVYWGRRYDKPGRDMDAAIKTDYKEAGIEVRSFNTTLLTEPWAIETKSGGYYKVFSPYWRALRSVYTAPSACKKPQSLSGMGIDGERIEDWELHPENPDWSKGFDPIWTPGEAGAHERLDAFLEDGLRRYGDNRNRPDIPDGTSGLSPHLRFGEISPAQIWRAVKSKIDHGFKQEKSACKFLSEVAWREFSYVLFFHNPGMGWDNYDEKFDAMPWKMDRQAYEAWQAGKTGYPIVDAGMRQLWETGWMHNRVRMIVASFLTKHLMIHWRDGEAWFWDTLVDADPASNTAGWQWTAGSGADAAPYFRIFNPITQGEKFDPSGAYVRRWCPELKDLPDKHLHSPWTADKETLAQANITLGEAYPHPIIDHSRGRERALEAWETLKQKQDAA